MRTPNRQFQRQSYEDTMLCEARKQCWSPEHIEGQMRFYRTLLARKKMSRRLRNRYRQIMTYWQVMSVI